MAGFILRVVATIIVGFSFMIEIVLKAITAVLVTVATIILAIFRPFCKRFYDDWRDTNLYQYGFKWMGGFLLTGEIYDLWFY